MMKTGMFFEWYPKLSGVWNTDKEEWTKLYEDRLDNKKQFTQYLIDKNDNTEQGRFKSNGEFVFNYEHELTKLKFKLSGVLRAMEEAVEKGDQFKMGLVFGQSIKEIANLLK